MAYNVSALLREKFGCLKIKFIILLILAVTIWPPVSAQFPDYHIQVIKGSNILNTKLVEEIIKDNKGFLWLLSPSQVQRFDGKNFKTFSFDDRCVSIQQDGEGNIWVASRNHIYVFRNDHSGFEDMSKFLLSKGRPRRLCAGPGKKLYLFTENGIDCWNSERRRFEPSGIPPFQSSGSYAILKSFGNVLFFAHNKALFRYNVLSRKKDSIICNDPAYLFPINEDSVWVRQGIDRTGLAAFTSHTITSISPHQFDEKFDNNLFFITGGFSIAPGKYFVLILNKGYFIYNAQLNRFKSTILYYKGVPLTENYPINGFCQDENGTVWLPHYDGLAYFRPFTAGFGLLRSNLVNGDKEWNNEVRCFAEDKHGNIWFGTGNGFCKWDKKSDRVKSWFPRHEVDNYLSYESVRSIGYDEGKIIVGQSERGFWIFDPVTEKFKRPLFENTSEGDNLKRKFLADFNGNMLHLRNGDFLVLSRYTWLIEKKTHRVKELIFEGSSGSKKNALEDAQGRLWIVGGRGIFAADNSYKCLYALQNAQLGTWLSAIVQIDAETFWVAAKNLYEMKLKGKQLALKPIFPELKTEHFTNLFKDSLGSIWMNSSQGIYRYVPERQALEEFDYSDNVQGTILTVSNETRSNDGTVYFGTVNGINYFLPERIPPQNDSLQPRLLNVTVNQDDSSFLITGELPRMKYFQNSLVFDFITPYLFNAEKVRYRYRLQGVDKDWINTGNNSSVRFTSLKPGNYSFQVAASLNDKDWFEIKSPLFFVIRPPFWQTWWFKSLLVLVISAAVWWLVSSLLQKLKAEKLLNSFATSLYGQNTIDDIFWDTARNCVQKLGFEDCVIYQKVDGRNTMVQRAAFGPKNPRDREILNLIEIPVGKGIVGSVAHTGKAEIIGNTSNEPRYIVDDERRSSEITVPIWIDGKVFAVIDSEHPQKNYYTRYHLRLLKKIAAICSERISKYLTEERLRTKIARDLHDEMGSTLTSINIISKVAMQNHLPDEQVKNYLQKIKDNSGRMMESMSDIVWAINPANDSFEKVVLRMKEFAAELFEPARINYYFIEEGLLDKAPLNLEQRKDIYMIFKEAVNNAVKYSQATEVNILLQKKDDSLRMMIIDNGNGFDTGYAYSGNGLNNMYSRAREMNANLSVDSIKGIGTTIVLDIAIT